MDMKDKYIKEMDGVRFSESFERDTVSLLKEAAVSQAQSRKGNIDMKRNKMFKIMAAAAAIVVLLTGTVYAARALLSPSEVARQTGVFSAAEAFESKDAIMIGETQTFGDYLLTLEGITSGEALGQFSYGIDDGLTGDKRSYAVFILERADGQPMPDDCTYEAQPFTLSPIVNGIEPWHLSIFSLDGSARRFVSGGVEYILIDTAGLEIFADRGVRIAAYEGLSPGPEIFAVYPNGTTDFAFGYDGERAMFDLPLDPAKADHEAVDKMLEGIEQDIQVYGYSEGEDGAHYDTGTVTYIGEPAGEDIEEPDGQDTTTTATTVYQP